MVLIGIGICTSPSPRCSSEPDIGYANASSPKTDVDRNATSIVENLNRLYQFSLAYLYLMSLNGV